MDAVTTRAGARTEAERTRRGVSSGSGERVVVLTGLVAGAGLGQIGGFIAAGPAQNVLFALSSIGLVAAAALLATSFASQGRRQIAAGFAVLAVAEVTIWSGGPGSSTSFAAGALFYAPALLLISLPAGFPVVVRALGAINAAAWAVYGFDYLLRAPTAPPLWLQVIGYILLTLTVLGWAAALGRRHE